MLPSTEDIAARLIAARKRAGISQEGAARLADVTTRQWSRYEKAELKPPLDVLYRFAKGINRKIGDLIPIDDDLPGLGVDTIPIERVPIVNRIPASGFITSYNDELVTEWVVTTKVRKKGTFALRVVGDSMAPRIEEGDIVILSPGEEFVNNKIYAVVTDESEHTLKRVKRVEGGYLCIPLNPNYEPIYLKDSDVLRLIRVVQIVKET